MPERQTDHEKQSSPLGQGGTSGGLDIGDPLQEADISFSERREEVKLKNSVSRNLQCFGLVVSLSYGLGSALSRLDFRRTSHRK